MEVKEFQELALRTESKIDAVGVNEEMLVSVLELFTNVATVLDAFKKSIYYHDDKKLVEISEGVILEEMQDSMCFIKNQFKDNNFKRKTIMDVNPRVLHGITGMGTESGELVEALLESLYFGLPIDRINVSEEMHDSSWYMAVIHDELMLDWNEGLANLITKLKIRFPNKFTIENAATRDLNTERKALEGKV